MSLSGKRLAAHVYGLVALAGCLLLAQSCGWSSAPKAEARLQSSNRLKELFLGVELYRTANEGAWPEDLEQVEQFLDKDLESLLHNPVTGNRPGYEYVQPLDDADLSTTVVLYQLRDGQRAQDLRVVFGDGHMSQWGSQTREN